MRWLSLAEVLELHRRLIQQSGGACGLRDLRLLESALGQPFQTFGGQDLYPEFLDKVSCLGFCLIQNHPFVDGNKRIGHAAMEVVMVLNGFELLADVEASESVVLAVASGALARAGLACWLAAHQCPLDSD
jgi:death-on-curing protein